MLLTSRAGNAAREKGNTGAWSDLGGDARRSSDEYALELGAQIEQPTRHDGEEGHRQRKRHRPHHADAKVVASGHAMVRAFHLSAEFFGSSATTPEANEVRERLGERERVLALFFIHVG